MGRSDTASRLIAAPACVIYKAFIDAEALAAWLPPAGMTGRFEQFEPWPGGRYRMILTYDYPEASMRGKSSGDADHVQGVFVAFEPDRRVVQNAEFESDDPDFSGTMTVSWVLDPADGGTMVTVKADNVPVGISAEDHAKGLSSSLANLARFCRG